MGFDYDQIPRDFVPTTYRETTKAVRQTYDVFSHNEKLRKDIEFGLRATWEVIKWTSKRVGTDVIFSSMKIPGLRSVEAVFLTGRLITIGIGVRSFFIIEGDVKSLEMKIKKIHDEIYSSQNNENDK